ncbi:MAG: MFS transporter [Verrucomicrobia bacterium]|nr:MFS transporter [Verrucomicrobiota bacterium]
MRKPSLLIIFLTVFIDLVGFGLIFPLLPIYSQNFGASGFMIGAIIAVYSLMQFIFAPIWGRLSDRIGRRPILLISTGCASISYMIFAFGSGMEGSVALWVILISRLFAGICGANISVAQAYIADITPPEKRSARMGLIGMAFGLGFVFGPALGGFSIKWFGLMGPGWVAAVLTGLNFLWVAFMLPESWKPSTEPVMPRPRLAQFTHTMSNPTMGLLIGIFFLATFCFASFETTIGLLVSKNFNLEISTGKGAETIAYLISYCAILGALVQGGAIGKLVKKMGEPKLIASSLIIAAVGMALIPYLHTWGFLLIGLGVFSIGSQLTRPPVFGMISMLTSANEQGTTMGVAQSIGSLARILGPMFAAMTFEKHPSFPYLVCAALSFMTGVLAWRLLKRPVHASEQAV